MTEGEWLSCTDPSRMLDLVAGTGRVSEWKLRLFAVACRRRIWQLLDDELSRGLIEAAERHADEPTTPVSFRQGRLNPFA